MNKFATLFWVVIIAFGLTLFIVGNNASNHDDMDNIAVSVSPTPTLESTPDTSPNNSSPNQDSLPTPTPFDNGDVIDIPGFVPRSEITGPGSCNLTGKITFLDQNTAMNDAFIEYDNIDSPARLIFWENSQDDQTMDIGPNIFGNLPLPSGSERVSVVFFDPPLASHYDLTAQVTYAIVDEFGLPIAVKRADCTGKIEVELSYL